MEDCEPSLTRLSLDKGRFEGLTIKRHLRSPVHLIFDCRAPRSASRICRGDNSVLTKFDSAICRAQEFAGQSGSNNVGGHGACKRLSSVRLVPQIESVEIEHPFSFDYDTIDVKEGKLSSRQQYVKAARGTEKSTTEPVSHWLESELALDERLIWRDYSFTNDEFKPQKQIVGRGVVLEVGEINTLSPMTAGDREFVEQERGFTIKRKLVTHLKAGSFDWDSGCQTNFTDDDFVASISNSYEESSLDSPTIEAIDGVCEALDTRRHGSDGNMGNFRRHATSLSITANLASKPKRFQQSPRVEAGKDYHHPAGGSGNVCKQTFFDLPSLSNQFSANGDKVSSAYSNLSGFNKSKLSDRLAVNLNQLRSMVERNLVATLICVYILVSFTLIVVLILPYVSNLPWLAQIDRRTNDAILGEETSKTHAHKSDSSTSFGQGETRFIKNSTFESAQVNVHGLASTSGKSGRLDDKNEEINPKSRRVDADSIALAVKSSYGNVSEQPISSASGKINPPIQSARLKNGSQAESHRVGQGESMTDWLVPSGNKEAKVGFNKSELAAHRFQNLWKISHKEQCQPMKIPFCSRTFEPFLGSSGNLGVSNLNSIQIPYDRTLLPNQFTRGQQSQIERVLQKYEPVIDIKCYALMPLFLCSIYAPKCIQINQTQSDTLLSDQDFVHDPSHTYMLDSTNVTELPDAPTEKASTDRLSKHRSKLVPPCRSLCRGESNKLTINL